MTQKCLDLNKLRKEFGDKEDKMNEVMKRIQEQNDQCTFFLTHDKYDGSFLECTHNKKKVTAPTEILTKARTHGALFHATGGGHISKVEGDKSDIEG